MSAIGRQRGSIKLHRARKFELPIKITRVGKFDPEPPPHTAAHAPQPHADTRRGDLAGMAAMIAPDTHAAGCSTLCSLGYMSAAVTGKRADINRIAVPMVQAAIKGGRILAHMAEVGERAGRGRQMSQGETFGTLKDLGFSRSRASRWQLAALLPDDDLAELQSNRYRRVGLGEHTHTTSAKAL